MDEDGGSAYLLNICTYPEDCHWHHHHHHASPKSHADQKYITYFELNIVGVLKIINMILDRPPPNSSKYTTPPPFQKLQARIYIKNGNNIYVKFICKS